MFTNIKINNIRSHRENRAFSGFSLIEILVVLVVLLIGIMAVLSLFPPGFLAILKTAQKTTALSLVNQQIESEKNQNLHPESIVSTTTHNDGTVTVNQDVLPEEIKDYTSSNLPAGTATGTDPYSVSNINRFRRIVGEAFRIPISTSNANKVYGGTYLLRFGPVANQFDTSKGTDTIKVYGSAMERIEMSSDRTPSNPDPMPVLKNASQYAIDYDSAKIAFYPRRAKDINSPGTRFFRITYDYYSNVVSGSGINSVFSIIAGQSSIAVPDDTTTPADQDLSPVWQPVFDLVNNIQPKNFKVFKRDSVDISRQFQLKSTTPVEQANGSFTFPDDDPYSYVWLSKQQQNGANAGVLVFNPTGHNEFVQTSSGTHPLTARVDYTTFDNHIIRDERSVPNQAPYIIRLSIPQVLVNGDQLRDNSTYTGMFNDPAKYNTPDVLVYNANTGEEISSLTNKLPSGIRFSLNAKDGIIQFNQDDIASKGLQSASLRIYYRAQNEWGMQILKANAHYFPTDSPLSMDYKSFYIGQSAVDGSNNPIGGKTKIYFPLCESGKTVVVGEYWIDTGAATPVRYSGEIYQVNDDAGKFLTLSDGSRLTWIDVQQQHSNAVQFVLDPPSGRAVSNIQGGSIKARAIWRSGDHWNKIDNDTFIAPSNN